MADLRISTVSVVACLLACAVAGCSSKDKVDGFNFNESDMRRTVAGTWEGPIVSTDDTATLKLEESGYLASDVDASTVVTQSISRRRVQNCGSRSFGDRTTACIGMTKMGIKGTLTSSGGTLPTTTVSGDFTLGGDDIYTGEIYLRTPRGDLLTVQLLAKQFYEWTFWTVDDTSYTLDLTHQ